MRTAAIAVAIALASAAASAHAAAPAPAEDAFKETRIGWNKPAEPFKIIGSVYYVGTAGLGIYLIVTPQGDILIDGGLPESALLVEKNIAALGFKLSDIKILLNSHAHFDHAGGLAEMKRATGAKLYISAPDMPIVERGRITFGPSATDPFPPAKVDHILKDGEIVRLGDAVLTAHLTPGHTPGCTTWTMPVTEDGTAHTIVFYCSTTVAGNPLVGNTEYPAIAADYRKSFAVLKTLKADVFLAPHASFYDAQGKHARQKPGAPNPFVDADEFQNFVAASEKDFETELAKQSANPPPK